MTPPVTAAPEESLLLSYLSNPDMFAMPDREYIDLELSLRPWMTIRNTLWGVDRFLLTARVNLLPAFLNFCRLLALGLEPSRNVQVQYIPCSDDEHWFTIHIVWQDEQQREAAVQALVSALWSIPI